MADDKNLRGGQDRARISAEEEYELKYIAEKMVCSVDEVREAIEKVGNSREKVEEYLRWKERR